jgi:hypothetical protein
MILTSKNLLNLTFSRLTVISGPKIEIRKNTNRKIFLWEAKCSCGSSDRYYNSFNLQKGVTKSCGCHYKELVKTMNLRYNEYEVIPDPTGAYVLVKLTQNQYTMCGVDEWFRVLINHKWCALKHRKNGFYVATSIITNGKHKTTHMHRMIYSVTDSKVFVDHKNHDTLDNRKNNIRIAIAGRNQQNALKRKNNTSGYIGVHWHISYKRWVANIHYKHKRIHLGSFFDLTEAAKNRDLYTLFYYKEFSVLNFPELIEEYKEKLKTIEQEAKNGQT